MWIEKNETPNSSIIWTETSPKSKLNEMQKLLNHHLKDNCFRVLLQFLDKKDYIWFQKEIGLVWSQLDGKLWNLTYDKLKLYIEVNKSRFSLVGLFGKNREYVLWTETSPKSTLKEIRDILQKKQSDVKAGELLSLIQKKKYKIFQEKIGLVGNDCDGKLWKKTLTSLEKYLDIISTSSWKVILERDKDMAWKYKVYSYIVRRWGQPKHIRREYERQIWWNIKWIKITNVKWVEYKESTSFKANDKVFIKVPIETLDNMDKDTKEKIKIQEDYVESQKDDRKQMLQRFNKQNPMWKDVKFSFWMPVYQYDDIDKTLASITTNQKNIDPKTYEVVILLNKPNKDAPSPLKTQQKIEKFKKEHPEYNICVFEKTFNFQKDKEGKYKVNYGKLYKVLWDTIVYRSVQRKNIKWMDMKKIRDLIIKTWAADSTDKNPKYIENQFKHYSNLYDGKELVRIIWESRLPKDVCINYPLIEILEFFQRYFDNEYAWWPLNRNVWVWTYKSWTYCDIKWFDGVNYPKKEDKDLVKRIRECVNKPGNVRKIAMYHDDFVWAVDESCDRWIWWMVEKGISYCDRYDYKEWDIASKQKNWNTFAIEHKWESKFRVLELTVQNLEKNLSSYYNQKITSIFNGKTTSRRYHWFKDDKWKYVPWYEKWAGKNATAIEKKKWIAKNVVDPIMEKVLQRPDFMWLNRSDYQMYFDEKWNPQIKFVESAITKIKAIQQKKIKDWYYNYWK